MIILKFLFTLILAAILFVLVIAVFFAFRFKNMLNVFINGNKQANARSTNDSQRTQSSSQSTTSSSSSQNKKIFGPDDGEYVEFEEVP